MCRLPYESYSRHKGVFPETETANSRACTQIIKEAGALTFDLVIVTLKGYGTR